MRRAYHTYNTHRCDAVQKDDYDRRIMYAADRYRQRGLDILRWLMMRDGMLLLLAA